MLLHSYLLQKKHKMVHTFHTPIAFPLTHSSPITYFLLLLQSHFMFKTLFHFIVILILEITLFLNCFFLNSKQYFMENRVSYCMVDDMKPLMWQALLKKC